MRREKPAWDFRAGCACCLVLACMTCAAFLCGCIPPPTSPGYVCLMGAKRGQGNVHVEAGVGTFAPRGAAAEETVVAGTLHVDTHVTEKLSIPASISLDFTSPHVGTRSGVRYRIGKLLALGGGSTMTLGDYSLGFGIDGEAVLGHRWDWFSFSLVGRPSIVCDAPDKHSCGFYMVSELSIAFFVARGFALTIHGLAAYTPGVFVPTDKDDVSVVEGPYWGVGGGVGFVAEF